MTVLRNDTPFGLSTTSLRNLVVGLSVAVGVLGTILAIDRIPAGDPGDTFSGTMVERSLAMQRNLNSLIEGGQAQAAALAAAGRGISGYVGPMAERGRAMQENLEAVIAGGMAQASALAVAEGLTGPMAKRSLAMQENLDALIEGGRAQAALLGDK